MIGKPVRDETGQSMLELAIVLPVLLFLVISVVETGRAMNQYLSISHIVYEGARYAASLAGMESGESGGQTSSNQMHDRVRSRVQFLLDKENFAD
ncbi:MAG: pilus assembly protein, partial [Bdellovibrionales bacterium]|nr:pilus assembly protein [Bdellovibrionales bacterium]